MNHKFNLTQSVKMVFLGGVVAFGVLSLYLFQNKLIYILTYPFFFLGESSLSLSFICDWKSFTFLFSVSTISASVILYSQSYMANEKFFSRFHLLVLSFVCSMLILIFSSNFILLIIGWDGLGVTSFLLVIYFQNKNSLNAGLLTILTNRIGDVLILISMSLFFVFGSWELVTYVNYYSNFNSLFLILLIISAFTKSAQIPFSSWLPAAMAAPTPVSSLVHSSTLVTAGVFMLIRFDKLLVGNEVILILLFTGCSTMFMAGVSGLYEMDMKKMVALSTLSQLGLMMTILGLGYSNLAFFHLITHAYFKALLFMVTGSMIHSISGYQDLRSTSIFWRQFPLSSSIMLVSNLSLLGAPFLSGFYSKDLFLESSLSMSMNSVILMLIFVSTSVTALYTTRFIYLTSFKSLEQKSLVYVNEKDKKMVSSFKFLLVLAVSGGSMLSWSLFEAPELIYLTKEMKNFTLLMILGSIIAMLTNIPSNKKFTQKMAWGWGSMWSLPFLAKPFLKSEILSSSGVFYSSLDNFWASKISFQGFSFSESSYSLKLNQVSKMNYSLVVGVVSIGTISMMLI